jgi:hypothetical protein
VASESLKTIDCRWLAHGPEKDAWKDAGNRYSVDEIKLLRERWKNVRAYGAIPENFVVENARIVNWNLIQKCLLVLHTEAKAFLSQAILIGGAACWFYRIQLEQARDPDFHVAPFSPGNESHWLSKDIDFTGIFSQDAFALLPGHVTENGQGHRYLQVAGVRIGFAQVGLTFAPDDALSRATIGSFDLEGQEVQFQVIDPVLLYLEKQALTERRGQQHDQLHFWTMREFLCLQIVRKAELGLAGAAPVAELGRASAFLADCTSKTPEILRDERIKTRIRPKLKGDDISSLLIARQLGL